MRTLIAFVLLLVALPGSPAQAQSLPEVQGRIASILGEIEGNLTEREAIEMNFKDWQSHYDAFKPRLDEYNRRMDEANAYCQGTYEHDEYLRRKAQCDATDAQLATLIAQLEPERVNLEQQLQRLQQRDTERTRAADGIQLRLAEALKQMTFACAMLSTAEYAAQCHTPAAPGPRTAAMVAQINADLAGRVPQ